MQTPTTHQQTIEDVYQVIQTWNDRFSPEDTGWTVEDITTEFLDMEAARYNQYKVDSYVPAYTSIIRLISPHQGKISAGQTNMASAVRRAVKKANPGQKVTIDRMNGSYRIRVWS